MKLTTLLLRASMLVAIAFCGAGSSAWGQDVLLSEDFASIKKGNSTSTSGSNTSWDGNDNFPSSTLRNAYQAGGAVKIGTSQQYGGITSKALNVSAGTLTVAFDVKGWSTVEGKIKVTIGSQSQTITYTASMSDPFESKSVVFNISEAGSMNVKIESTKKRAFLDNIVITNTASVTPEPITVNVGKDGYATFVVPEAVRFPEGVTANIVTAINPNSMHMEPVAAVPEGTAVVVKAAQGSYTLSRTTETDDVDDNLLQASDGNICGDGSTIYALGVGKTGAENGVVGFYKVKNGVMVPAGKAYIVVSSGNPVKNYIAFDFGGDTDAIENLDVNLDVNSGIYDIAGQRIEKMQKGIYVVNGKKVIVK